jgi:prepilin-type N-terminal cleavage/methylation domain-containing protein
MANPSPIVRPATRRPRDSTDRSGCRGRIPRGFTLVELVTVIVILGVIAAVAFPRFINLTSDAERGAVAALAGAVATAQQTSFAEMLVKSNGNPYMNSPRAMNIDDFIQCDGDPLRVVDRAPNPARQLALAEYRRTLVANPGEGPVCSRTPDQIQFTSKSGRVITITHGPNTITWSASPSY